VSLVDFNRAGVPLMEIVTEPDIRTAEQARRYAEELRLLLRTIDVSDAEMENGQMRVEANVSLRPRGTAAFGIRTEVKNMNSLRAVERAIGYEIERQAAALDAGKPLRQETRGWDDAAGATYVMRVKESSDDYRYFPEPDLPPLHLDPAWLDELQASLPERPAARRGRYVGELGLSPYDAAVLTADESMSRAFEAIREAGPDLPPKEIANLVTGDYARALRETTARTVDGLAGRSDAASLAHVLGEVLAGRLSRPNAKDVVAEHVASGAPSAAIIAARGFAQISDAGAVERLVDEVVAANAAAVADYRSGKAQAVGYLVGQVMKASRGQAHAGLVQAALRKRLGAPDATGEDPG
jgi:aspartyl-tRNA(Asn)/glutamyl-tRNA(Gln) amidotransferase subunit B